MSVTVFMERVKRDGLGDISAWQAYRSKEKALKKIRGSVVEHYKLLWDYCGELKRTNIGTTALVEGTLENFDGCRRVIGVDGCFLKTELGSQLLIAVGVDANNGMYPVAYGIVEVENGDNWKWFLELLKDDLHIHSSQHWIFISDKQKGLTNGIGTLFENSKHRTCVRHLYNNFSVCHKGLALKNCLWDAARATTISQWRQHMQQMMDLDPDPAAYGWLEEKPASHWSKSHFREWNQCDMLLNNLCESFNSTIVAAREKPILTMLEDIRVYLMRRIVARRESCDRWTIAVGPRIQKILDKNGKLARFEWAEYAGNEKFQVRHNAGIVLHAMDLRARTCTCRGWQLSGIACSHVIASVVSRGLNVSEFVDDIYKKDAYMRTYTPSISPITGPDAWPTPGLNPLTPPVYTKRPGRPKKNRRKELNEVASSSQPKRSSQSKRNANTSQSTSGTTEGQRKRSGLIMTCTKCGETGHNRRGYKGAPPPAPC
ncbi:uncharacterized protein LOC111372463 [Olea europaea var. sylvestris]|uniref:uncharacterized protein LOC111372463 n=1 Tax=Olea europaea var. sylvestris TaxID=158386 RepID=UPI000C1CF129|nr:uncharacterized protein LOC111372463 [Olea europaea var. sylvestris]